ncbi:MAG: hypothetical protein Q8P18_16225 [Pseudomonadota bacterium]|nr:hypothetical protein [Pseudomonadota bacterium]
MGTRRAHQDDRAELTFGEMLAGLSEVERWAGTARAPRARKRAKWDTQGWGGAGVIFATCAAPPDPHDWRPDPLTVVTPHAHAIGRLIRKMQPILGPCGDAGAKYEFYERLAGAALSYQAAVGGIETETGILLAVVAEARAFVTAYFSRIEGLHEG